MIINSFDDIHIQQFSFRITPLYIIIIPLYIIVVYEYLNQQ